MTSNDLLSIGALSGATAVSVSTLRYYDDLGLITPVTRVGGKRRFDTDTVGRVNFIVRSKRLGFSLSETAELLDDSAGAWRGHAARKRDELRSRRKELDVMVEMLDEALSCSCDVIAECPRIERS